MVVLCECHVRRPSPRGLFDFSAGSAITPPCGPSCPPRSLIRHARHFGSQAVRFSTCPQACTQPERGEEGQRGRSGCGGERGGIRTGPARAHSAGLHHRHQKAPHPSLFSPHTGHHSQMRCSMCRGLRWACGVGIRHISSALGTRCVWLECLFLFCLSRPDPP